METKNNDLISETKVVSGKKLLSVRINRDTEKGFQISLQSPLNWSFLKHPDNRTVNIGGVRCFNPKREMLDGVNGRFYRDNLYKVDDYPNLQLLLAENINKGVTFNFGVFPVSEDEIRDWVHKLKEQVKLIYLAYCKPVDTTVVINTQTVERESHD